MANQNRTTDEFGWGTEVIDPAPYDVPPFHNGDTVTLVRRNTTDDQQWQPWRNDMWCEWHKYLPYALSNISNVMHFCAVFDAIVRWIHFNLNNIFGPDR